MTTTTTTSKYNYIFKYIGWSTEGNYSLISPIPIIFIKIPAAEVFNRDVLAWHQWSHQDTFNTELPATAESGWEGHGAIQRTEIIDLTFDERLLITSDWKCVARRWTTTFQHRHHKMFAFTPTRTHSFSFTRVFSVSYLCCRIIQCIHSRNNLYGC